MCLHMWAHTHTQPQREHCAELVFSFHVQNVDLVPIPKNNQGGRPGAVLKDPKPSLDVQKA